MKKTLLFLIIFSIITSCISTNHISKNDEIFNLNKSLEEIIDAENTEIFRLISEVKMGASTDILVIENKNDEYSVYYFEKEFKRVKTSKFKISKEKYESFIKKLKELNFENLEGYKSNNVDDGIESVSYTHLDVYKRQFFLSARNENCTFFFNKNSVFVDFF